MRFVEATTVGEKEAVALMRGATHDERVESELSSERKEEQDEVMLVGMRMLSVEFELLLDCGRGQRKYYESQVNSALTCAETAPARASAKRAYFIMVFAKVE